MLHATRNFVVSRSALAPPFHLVVVDYDTCRYALEGPIEALTPWDREVQRMRRAGRDVWSFPITSERAKEAATWFQASGFTEWPSLSIVEPFEVGEDTATASHPVCAGEPKNVTDARAAEPNVGRRPRRRRVYGRW